MSIQAISSGITAYYANSPKRASTTDANLLPAADGQGGSKETVTISSEAWQALAAEDLSTIHEEAVREGIPDEIVLCQVPSWLVDFGLDPSDSGFAKMYPQAAAAPKAVLDQFGRKVFEHYASVVTANGLSGNPMLFHQKLITDRQSSEQIRQQFVAGIRQDADMMSLMKQLGLTGMLAASDSHGGVGSGLASA